MINWYSKRFPFPRKGLKYFLRLLKISGNANRSFTRKLPNGLYIVVSPFEHIQQQLFWYGWYEKEYVRTWEALVQKGSTVIDIGANIGYYSLVAAKKGAKVLAFEPAPEHFSQLKKNIALNNLEQVHCFQQVVSDSNGLVPLYYSHSYNTGMTGLSQPEEFSGKKEMVPSVILDEVLQELGITQAGFIKIDIEGAELLALKGMGRILEQMDPVLFLEIDNRLLQRFGHTAREVYDHLHSFGYTPFRTGKNLTLSPAPYGWEDELVIFMKKRATTA